MKAVILWLSMNATKEVNRRFSLLYFAAFVIRRCYQTLIRFKFRVYLFSFREDKAETKQQRFNKVTISTTVVNMSTSRHFSAKTHQYV